MGGLPTGARVARAVSSRDARQRARRPILGTQRDVRYLAEHLAQDPRFAATLTHEEFEIKKARTTIGYESIGRDWRARRSRCRRG